MNICSNCKIRELVRNETFTPFQLVCTGITLCPFRRFRTNSKFLHLYFNIIDRTSWQIGNILFTSMITKLFFKNGNLNQELHNNEC